MASGTIPAIVYYCLKFITPSTFVICAFIICCTTSFLISTSLGTVSVVGIPIIILAKSGNMNLNIVAGAVIAGAYFGDRSSPMSSSAALIANLTETNIFTNIKNMFYSSTIPFLLSLIFYYVLSVSHPLRIVNNNLSGELLRIFNINLIMLLPAAIILVLSLCKAKIDISILVSSKASQGSAKDPRGVNFGKLGILKSKKGGLDYANVKKKLAFWSRLSYNSQRKSWERYI